MSEGELKERIRFFFGVKAANTWQRFDIDEVEEQVLKLLDAACKEFPKKHEPIDWRGNKPPATYDENEIDTWFLKKFGGGKADGE